MKIVICSIMLTSTIFFQNCATGPTHGILYTNTKFPGEFNPANDVRVTKTAEGCNHQILTLFTIGDSGAGTIAKENGIERIATIDHSTITVLDFFGLVSVYRSYCTIVSGDGK